MNTKRCKDCGEVKPLDDFHRNNWRKDGHQSFCKPCHNARAATWRSKHPDFHQERLARDPMYFRRQKLRKLYGISLEDYDALLEQQGGVCAICKQPEARQLQGRPAPLVVDHDHVTGKVRGLLCHSCNTPLAFVERRGWLHAAQAYLEAPT
jgi:hypothetical protein